MRWMPRLALSFAVTFALAGCSRSDEGPAPREPAEVPQPVRQNGNGPAGAANGNGVIERPAAPLAGFAFPISAADAEAGWLALFDEHSLFGWEATSDANWSVADGVLRADAGTEGFLMSHVPFADFEFRCEYRLEKGGNSGIFLRTIRDPQDPATDCYEFNLCDSHPAFPTGSIVGRKKTGAKVDGEGTWKRVALRVEGRKVIARIDEQLAIDFQDDSQNFRPQGFIGLQKKEGRIEFRNVAVRPLGGKPIFDGRDLSAWREVPGSKSEFAVEDESIRVTNGPGFLETRDAWVDFVLQGQAKTNGDGLNSGIFFRALPGTAEAPSNGYEFQIHNAFKNGDPTQPADFGTGAIYRRQPARRIVSRDEEWFAFALVAAGPRFQSWVNGYPVLTWIDDRAPDENPRRGQRLAAGHISLQGHDPTTDLQFRAIRIAPLPR